MLQEDSIAIAVLPFEDLSLNEDLGIFCRSFSADLITELSRFKQLKVIKLPANSHSINDHFPLNIHYYASGTFRSEKELIKINVQLYNSKTKELVWGNRLEGKLSELPEIQDNLVRAVVSVLQQQINLDLISKLKKRPKVAFTAYEHWLYGMEELKKGSVETDLRAREHFQEALQLQPDYSLACTGMSLSFFNEWTCQLWDRWDISKSGAYEWAQKAIELDDQNHIIAMVLGRIFLYEGSYDTAEYYFRKSLMLNPNDPDTLLPIALYIVYLGLEEEALELYERGLELNPFFDGNHLRLGGFIYFELGQYEKAASFVKLRQHGYKIADTEAYAAAIFYHLNDSDKMHYYWNAYLQTYNLLIAKGKNFEEQEAIDWLLKLNPHRYKTNLEEFLKFISKGNFQQYPLQNSNEVREENHQYIFVRENTTWKFCFEGKVVQSQEVKGFYDLQKLLEQPGQVFHCAELMGTTLDSNGEKLIDEKARRQYQKKILELQSEIEQAEINNDFSQIESLQKEYDQLIEHLSQSLGFKGKVRETGNSVEKARSAVTWRIRSAIARIEKYHPRFGAHLSNAVKTGTLCTYKPEREIVWVT